VRDRCATCSVCGEQVQHGAQHAAERVLGAIATARQQGRVRALPTSHVCAHTRAPSIDVSMDELARLFPEQLIRIVALSKEMLRALEPAYHAPDAPPLDSRVGTVVARFAERFKDYAVSERKGVCVL
jgi:hypothetical protein